MPSPASRILSCFLCRVVLPLSLQESWGLDHSVGTGINIIGIFDYVQNGSIVLYFVVPLNKEYKFNLLVTGLKLQLKNLLENFYNLQMDGLKFLFRQIV